MSSTFRKIVMGLQKLSPTIRFCLVVFCSAAALAASANARSASAPGPTGASQVGTVWQRLVDVSRNDPFLQNGAKRELMVRFWYPAAPGRCAPAEYASPKVWAYLSQISGF